MITRLNLVAYGNGRILLEIGTPGGEDPVWTFFDSQHNHITSLMKSTQTVHIARIEGAFLIII